MQQPADSLPSSNSPSFAGLLAALTQARSHAALDATPAPQGSARRPGWREDELEDDVATLSYERALQKNARYKPINSDVWEDSKRFEFAAVQGPLAAELPLVAQEKLIQEKRVQEKRFEDQCIAEQEPEAAPRRVAAIDEKRKRASVTVRLSEAEYEQLHARAAEAGLTVSAYLRSCTFEADALRAQVKEALATLRAGQMSEKPAARESAPSRWKDWLSRLFPRLQSGPRMARA